MYQEFANVQGWMSGRHSKLNNVDKDKTTSQVLHMLVSNAGLRKPTQDCEINLMN